MALPSLPDADAAHRELPAVDADARGHRCCDRLRARYLNGLSAAVALPVEREQPEPSAAARRSTHRLALKQRSVLVELLEQVLKPAASLLQEPRLQLESRAQPRWPRADAAWLARLPHSLAQASSREQERRGPFRGADE